MDRWSKLAEAISEVMKWLSAASARRKEQALRAADAFIDITLTGMYKGKKLTEEREQQLKIHFAKQFDAWKRG